MYLTFLGSFLQVLIVCTINFYLLKTEGAIKVKVLLVFLSSLVAALLFVPIGILAVFLPVILLIVFNYWQTKSKLTSFIAPLYSLLILVISDHLSSIIDIHVFDLTITDIESSSYNMSMHLLSFVMFSFILAIITDVVIHQIRYRLPFIKSMVCFCPC